MKRESDILIKNGDKMSDLWHTRGDETRTGALSCPLDEDSLVIFNSQRSLVQSSMRHSC